MLTIMVRARLSWARSGLAASRLALGCEVPEGFLATRPSDAFKGGVDGLRREQRAPRFDEHGVAGFRAQRVVLRSWSRAFRRSRTSSVTPSAARRFASHQPETEASDRLFETFADLFRLACGRL
ncbi:MAG: hypothetical protein E5X21_07025 [Mesorhizobium sp.]|uniref:hypothetical protein n=1 Tax=unclassified Mesorhizobium TaxID=325217 RepID=UPI000F755E85|nr:MULTISPECIES: hypothetical protein [unclassified Mesorhizobium]RUV25599.1 hypothetical protein EOA91_07845 [Mesorhizobium sp. M1A.F.Ca.IN.022.04.1.1]RUV79009.1 hypothetical protein EOA50_03875 [Mesorhizobium sp. M1A.F.Ca.IN.020.30.1.1]TGV92937.1 hypothetical protein EN801_007355 [Mesorhizobium sp. M00.F.Ca.ET.158.01.1.1]AZO61985.1 hypothetical protein EJ078_24120 [Mesorhizobium sp. M1A.F.Ca.IN.022.06.1.1]MDF3169669.1 hypothetical protein [Mesorhizobium sp. P16.1]